MQDPAGSRDRVGNRIGRRALLGTLATGSALVLGGCLSPGTDSTDSTDSVDSEAIPLLGGGRVVKSPTCGCCEAYVEHLREQGAKLEVENVDDPTRTKRELGVPEDLWSCHTVRTDDYLVEGHVPLAAIAKLAAETPDVAGIALPGMPAGSPGMGGESDGPLSVYTFTRDGTVEPFTEV